MGHWSTPACRWLWTGLLVAWLFLELASVMGVGLKAPVLIGCVFIHRSNITCRWKPGDSQTTLYTLNVRRIIHSPKDLGNCSTLNTNCTVDIKNFSANFNFCINITAQSHSGSVSSQPRCQLGIDEVKLHPVKLDNIASVDGKPRCLRLTWYLKPFLLLFSDDDFQRGMLVSQIKLEGNRQTTVHNVKVTNKSIQECVFSPDTVYNVSLRHRYQRATSPWSQWSNELQHKTAEDAPSSAPMFWRKVIEQGIQRRTLLLWKPLPHALANGRVLFYNVTCQDENAEGLQNKGNCSNLNILHTSCVLNLPLGPCSCTISASTSVGTSPRGSMWLSKANGKEPPPPHLLSIIAVNDSILEIKWAPPSEAAFSLTGFIVEWFVVTQQNNSILHWEQVNSSTAAINITEGVAPFQRYAVSVRALYGKEGDGQSKTKLVYTREGVPAAVPQVNVQVSGSEVRVIWSLPVEQQHGFIRSYTLFYERTPETPKKVVLSSTADHHVLSLPPGAYNFWMQANTDIGPGEMGKFTSATISPKEFSLVLHVLLPIGLISLVLMMVCIAQIKIVKGKLCKEVPDPSHSSMAKWSPNTKTRMKFTKPVIEYSEVVSFCDRETENYASDRDKHPHVCSFPSTLTPDNPFKCETKYQTSARTSNMTDTISTSCPVIHSHGQVSSAEPTASLKLQHSSDPNVRLYEQPSEGVGELCPSNSKTSVPFYQIQQHPQFHNTNLNTFAPLPLLKPDSLSQTEPMQQCASLSCLAYPDLLFMDLTNTPQSLLQCDPYLPV